MRATNATLSEGSGWRQKAPSNSEKLRELLSDDRWHSQQTMQRVAGMRYGARLHELHETADIANGVFPLHYEKRIDGQDDSRVSYRRTEKARCDICTQAAKEKPSAIIERQAKRIEELEQELAKVRLAAGFQ
jgi:hypothetical protein